MQKRIEMAGIVAVVEFIIPAFHGSSSRSLHLDRSRLGLLGLRQHEREDAVLELGSDLALIDLARKMEASRIMTDVVLRIERLQSLILGQIKSPFDLENAVLDPDIDVAFLDARHLDHDRQGVLR